MTQEMGEVRGNWSNQEDSLEEADGTGLWRTGWSVDPKRSRDAFQGCPCLAPNSHLSDPLLKEMKQP